MLNNPDLIFTRIQSFGLRAVKLLMSLRVLMGTVWKVTPAPDEQRSLITAKCDLNEQGHGKRGTECGQQEIWAEITDIISLSTTL